MKTQEGGLSGTEVTGYDESDMAALIKQDVSGVMLSDDFDMDDEEALVYTELLQEHREHVLLSAMQE